MTTERSGMSLESAVAKIEAHDKYFSYAEADAWQVVKTHLSRDSVVSDDCSDCMQALATANATIDLLNAALAARHAAVPDVCTPEDIPRWWDDTHSDAYEEGWNDFRKAMIAQRDGG